MALNDAFRPTLLIGVGGTGISIAERVYDLARQTEQGQRGRIAVLGFDTNVNDLNRLTAIEKRSQIVMSTSDTIYQLLDKNPAVEKSWFGPRSALSLDILNMTLLAGAGQIRLLTRLGMHHVLTRGGVERIIGDAIARIGVLNSRERFDGSINVMIVGSLAGATGSGSFIQVALLVDQICRSRNINADIRGLFLLPDIYVHGGSLPTDQVDNVLANGYAALKELNGVNNLVNRRGDQTPFTFEYAPGHFLREGGQPFRSVSLIDFENVRGGSFGRSLLAYQLMAARAAYLLIFSPIGAAVASVGINDVRAKLGAAGEGSHNLYAGIGVSAVKYPADEMSRYLTLRLAVDNLDGDWLRLDRNFFERARRYEELRRQGSTTTERPDQGTAFIEDLQMLATKDRVAFFSEIYNRLNPRSRDERSGSEIVRPRHLTYLDSLIDEVTARYWARPNLAVAAGRPTIDSSQLNNKTVLIDTVRRLENFLDDDMRRIGDALNTIPEDEFRNILAVADDAAEGEWRDYHLQSYIIKDGPHLVEIRAFLYLLRQAIAQRRQALSVEKAHQRLMQASNQFDERGAYPTERRSPKTIAQAEEAVSENFLRRVLRGSFDQYRTTYADYYNGSLTLMRDWANQAVAQRVLVLLDEEIKNLETYLAGLFIELGAVFNHLNQQITNEENLHGQDRGAVDGNVWVYADARAKRSCWDSIRLRSVGLRLDTDANKALAATLVRRYRADRREAKTTDFGSLGRLFIGTVVDDFSRRVVEADFRSAFDIGAIEAVRREAELQGEDWRAYLRHTVDVASAQSEPFLSLMDANDGQRVIFWAVHPSVRIAINDDQTYNALFTFQQGEAPLEGEEFSEQELLCVNTRVNLELANLAKLSPGDTARSNINVRPVGRYAQAYKSLVDDLVEAELTETGRRPREFTPHLDASWHRPGAFPEIHPELAEVVRQDAARGAVASLALGLIELNVDYGRPVAEFSTVGKGASPSITRRLTDRHELWDVIDALEKHPELLRAALRLWDRMIESVSVRGGSNDDPLPALTAPDLVNRIVALAVRRDNADAREERVRKLLAAWTALLWQVVGASHPELAEPGRLAIATDHVNRVHEAVVAELRRNGTRDETVRALERVFLQATGQFGDPVTSRG